MNEKLIASLPKHITCIAVSKNQSIEKIKLAHSKGIFDFGENKVQELLSKVEVNQKWQWHFIGHLQTNKVRQLLPWISMIHSVDSTKLCHVIEKEAARINKTIPILLQLNLTNEASKFGMSINEATELLSKQEYFRHLEFKGFMIMGPTSGDEQFTKSVFDQAYNIFKSSQKNSPHIDVLSMGMSDDYLWAIERGATHIRLGRILFEE